MAQNHFIAICERAQCSAQGPRFYPSHNAVGRRSTRGLISQAMDHCDPSESPCNTEDEFITIKADSNRSAALTTKSHLSITDVSICTGYRSGCLAAAGCHGDAGSIQVLVLLYALVFTHRPFQSQGEQGLGRSPVACSSSRSFWLSRDFYRLERFAGTLGRFTCCHKTASRPVICGLFRAG